MVNASSKLLVGRKIVSVEFERFTSDQTGRGVCEVKRIVLDNGARLTFHVVETGADYAVEMNYHPAPVVTVTHAPSFTGAMCGAKSTALDTNPTCKRCKARIARAVAKVRG